MTLHHPLKPIERKRQQPWAKGLHRRDGRETKNAPPVAKVWMQMTGANLEGIRVALGLTEHEMARLLGIQKQNYLALQNGKGIVTGPAVKLLALLRSMSPAARKACVGFLISTLPGSLGPLDNPPQVGAILPTPSTD